MSNYEEAIGTFGVADLGALPAVLDLNTVSVRVRRGVAAALLNQYVPCPLESKKFKEITQGRAQVADKQGVYFSTCGFLPNWAMNRIGCRDLRFMNWDIPETAKDDWIVAQNVSKIYNGGLKAGVFKPFKKGMEPGLGDIVFISNGPSLTEHVLVHKAIHVRGDGTYWIGWDAGRVDKRGKQCAEIVERKLSDDGSVLDGRKIVGFLDIGEIPLTASFENWVVSE